MEFCIDEKCLFTYKPTIWMQGTKFNYSTLTFIRDKYSSFSLWLHNSLSLGPAFVFSKGMLFKASFVVWSTIFSNICYLFTPRKKKYLHQKSEPKLRIHSVADVMRILRFPAIVPHRPGYQFTTLRTVGKCFCHFHLKTFLYFEIHYWHPYLFGLYSKSTIYN